MQRRTTLKALAATAALIASPLLFAQSDYQLVKPPQPGGAAGSIEVIEFFSFGCGHCRNFEPAVNKWAETQSQDVVFRKVPVSFGDPSLQPLTRMYYTLEAMGLSKKLGPAMFEAVQVQRLRLSREDVRNDWLAKQGVDMKKFNDTWRSSFSVDSQTKRADQLTTAYKIMGVPSMAINGKYMIEGAGAQTLATTDRLIAQERAASPKK